MNAFGGPFGDRSFIGRTMISGEILHVQQERLEELIETVDEATDVPANNLYGAKRVLHRTSVAKRWMDGEIALHAHLWVRSVLGEVYAENLCLLFQRNRLVRDFVVQDDGVRVGADNVLERSSTGKQHLAHEGTVLVDVGEEAEDSEFVMDGVLTPCPATVRLRFLDECPCASVGVDSVEGAGATFGVLGMSDIVVELLPVGVDGEGIPLIGPITFQEDELPDEVVQGGSKVLDGVAANQTESRRSGQLVSRWVDVQDVPGSVKGVLKPKSLGIRLEEGAKFLVQNVQVFVGPTEFQPGTVERRTHKG
jgi:hypothetical protein